MATRHEDYNEDSFTSGIENIVQQTFWSIHFSHVPTSRCVFFEAFLTNYVDTFNSTWNRDNVFGRMDPIVTFQNTQRIVSFGFKAVAESAISAANNLHRFQHLSSFLYPTYETQEQPNKFVNGSSQVLTMNQSPLIRIKFANLIQDANALGTTKSKKPVEQNRDPTKSGLVGYVEGFNFAPVMESGFFSGGPGVFYPAQYQVDVVFNVLHNHELGWGINGEDDKGSWLGPEAFPNGDGTRGVSGNRRNECVPKSERITSKLGTAINAADTEGTSTKSKERKKAERKILGR